MKPRDKLPIETLSEAVFARVEAAVFAELDAPERTRKGRPLSRRLALPLVAAVALPLGAVLALLWRAAFDTAPQHATNTTLASMRVVANEGYADTMFSDVSIRLERGASLVAVRDGVSGSLVLLERGVARFAVPPRAQRPFSVQADEVTIEVVGTRFEVSRSDASVQVRTMEGVVRVTTAGNTVLLRAGETWSSTNSASPATPPTDAGQEDMRGPALPTAAPPATHADTGSRASKRLGAAVTRELSSTEERERFELASRLEVVDPVAALRIYASLVARDGRWGETALYAQARLEFELGHSGSAGRLLGRYLREHPAGANADDVRALLTKLDTSGPRARE